MSRDVVSRLWVLASRLLEDKKGGIGLEKNSCLHLPRRAPRLLLKERGILYLLTFYL